MKTIATEIDQFYTVVDNNYRHVLGDFKTIEEVFKAAQSYCRGNFGTNFKEMYANVKKVTYVKAEVRSYYTAAYRSISGYDSWSWGYKTFKNIYVLDAWGDLVDIFADEGNRKYWRKYDNPYYNWRSDRNDAIEKNLIIKKHNVDKIKESYAKTERWYNSSQEVGYKSLATKYYSRVKVIGAHRQMVGIIKEEGEPEFRGGRRNLPRRSWMWDEEKAIGTYDTYKSWKHNSKRCKQWKVK